MANSDAIPYANSPDWRRLRLRTDAPLALVLLEVRDGVEFRRFELGLFDRSQPRPFREVTRASDASPILRKFG